MLTRNGQLTRGRNLVAIFLFAALFAGGLTLLTQRASAEMPVRPAQASSLAQDGPQATPPSGTVSPGGSVTWTGTISGTNPLGPTACTFTTVGNTLATCDRFLLTVNNTNGSNLDVRITWPEMTSDLDLYLCQGTDLLPCTTIVAQSTQRLTNFEQLNVANIPSGNYYVVVVDFAGATSYTGTASLNLSAAQTATAAANQTATVGNQLTAVAVAATQTAGSIQTAVARATQTAGSILTAVAGATQTAGAATQTAIACAVRGSLTNTDGTQVGRLNEVLTASNCATPGACPGKFPGDDMARRYDAYTYVNTSGTSACITVSVNARCLNGVLVQSAAYLGSFDPNNLCANYLGSAGNNISQNPTYSINVPAGGTYVVTVNELVSGTGCSDYDVIVTNNGVCQNLVTTSGTQTAVVAATQTAAAGATQTANAANLTATAVAGSNAATQTAFAANLTATANAANQTATANAANRTATAVAGSNAATQTAFAANATQTANARATQTAQAGSSTPCPIQFTDVLPGSTFYEFIRCLACRGIISGYADRTFRPFNDVTRGQIAKMISNSAGLNNNPGPQIYEDVDQNNPFFIWINRLTQRNVMGGYPCGGPNEPCGTGNRPYFRWGANATRGQISKIASNAAGYTEAPGTQIYEDVAPDNPFYEWVNRLTNRGVMGGYPCGSVNPANGSPEPCGTGNKPYYRWANQVTRGQASKIVANTFFPNCQTP